MSRKEKENPSTTVFFTEADKTTSVHFMKQVGAVSDMCKDLPVYDFYKGTELDNEKRFVSEIPRQMLRITYDFVGKEIPAGIPSGKKIIVRSSFRGTTYEIHVIVKW